MADTLFKWNWRSFALLLALVLTVWLSPSIIGGKVLLPLDILTHNPPNTATTQGPVHNGLIGDMLYENFAWKTFQREAIAQGDLPLWNPYTFCGHPVYTTGQTSTFYPLNAIFYVLPVMRAYVVYTWLHLFLGGMFMFWFCRRMGIGGFGASVGGIAFAMGGFLCTRLLWPMLLGSAIWLPLQLIWIDWMAETPRLERKTRGLLLGAVSFALPLLSGFLEIAFYAFFACGVFTLFRAGRLIRTDRAVRPVGVFLGKVAAVPLLAAMLAAPQLLPFFEVMKRNVRAEERPNFEAMKGGAVAPAELLTMVSPDILGNPSEHDYFSLSDRQWHPIRARDGSDWYYFGPKNYVEVGFYFGILPLVFVLLSLPAGGRCRGFAWTLAALAVAFALVTPIYKAFYYVVPGAQQVRTPFRWLYLALFAGTCLAAVGAQYWYDRLARPTRKLRVALTGMAAFASLVLSAVVVGLLFVPGPVERWASSFMNAVPRAAGTFKTSTELAGFGWLNAFRFAMFMLAALLCVALGWWRMWSPRAVSLLSLAAVGLVALDLGQASFSFYTQSDPAVMESKPALVQSLQADKEFYRIGRYGPDKVLYANLPLLYGIQDFGGYDSILLTDYIKFLSGIENQHLAKFNIVMTIERPRSLDSPLLPLLNIRYLLTPRGFNHPDWQQVPIDGNVKLYRVRPERELPRAFLVSSVHSVASLEAAVAAIKSGEVDVFHSAVVEGAAEVVPSLADKSTDRAGTASIVAYRPSLVSLETTSDRRAFLVLLDVIYPGWNAYVDGEPAAIYRTNGVFRGVSVPGGKHTVEFRFQPRSFRIGLAICAGCMVVLVIFGAVGRRPRPPQVSLGIEESVQPEVTRPPLTGEAPS